MQNLVSDLNIQRNSVIRSKDFHNLSDPFQRAIAKYKHHSSALSVQSKISNRYNFFFSGVSKIDVGKEIKNINPKKATAKK